jgi:hypothetical protein
MTTRHVGRRAVVLGSFSALATGALNSCGGNDPVPSTTRLIGPHSDQVRNAERLLRTPGQRVVTNRITAQPTTVDLGSRTVQTWSYGDTVPGPVLRTTAGDLLRAEVTNNLPSETSVHWHGLALSNDMDGVPGITQDPIASGGVFTYEFTAASGNDSRITYISSPSSRRSSTAHTGFSCLWSPARGLVGDAAWGRVTCDVAVRSYSHFSRQASRQTAGFARAVTGPPRNATTNA